MALLEMLLGTPSTGRMDKKYMDCAISHNTTIAIVIVSKVARLLDRWGAWYVLSFRFLYGLRTVSPIAIGLTSISALRFTALNLVAAAIWSVVGSILGYEFGNAIEIALGRLEAWQHRILAVLAIVLTVYVLYRLVRRYLWRRVPLP